MPAEVMVAVPEEEFKKNAEKIAMQTLKKVKRYADEVGVSCQTRAVQNVRPWQAIVDEAVKEKV